MDPSAQVQPPLPADPGTKPVGLGPKSWLGLRLSRGIAGGPVTGGGGGREGGLNDGGEGFPGVGVGGSHYGDLPREDAEEDLQARDAARPLPGSRLGCL